MSTWVVFGIYGRAPGGKTVPKDDKSATRWFVRWRLDGVDKKRTLPTKGYAKTFHENLLRASVMSWHADERGWPIDPTRPASASLAPNALAGHSNAAADHLATSGMFTLFSGSARTFASYCDEVWWPTMSPTFGDKNMLGHRRNMRVARDLLIYRDDDPRCAYPVTHPAYHPAARLGASILLHHLTADDLLLAVVPGATSTTAHQRQTPGSSLLNSPQRTTTSLSARPRRRRRPFAPSTSPSR